MQTRCCIYFNTEINGGWVNLSWSGVKEGEIKIIHKLVYVWLRSIYLAISAKTSSCKEHHCVRNMISLRYRKIFHTAEKLQGFISFGHQTHSWLLLTARTNRKGRGHVTRSLFARAVTIHQTHDSVCITIFDPRFGSYHDFFRGEKKKKKKRFLKQYFLLNNILKIFINWTPKNKINYANY